MGLYILAFIFGTFIGSFVNVLILRIPNHENFITERSHCPKCGYVLKPLDLVPVLSYMALRGRCRNCHEKISVQYPLIEILNGVLYLATFAVYGFSINTLLYFFFIPALIALSVIDARTFEIPEGFIYYMLLLGAVRVATDYRHTLDYVIGFFSVSLLFLLILLISKGRAMGGGDVKLMAVTGLIIGWKLNILALILGCILGSVIHLLRMRFKGADHTLAFGPYLSMGVTIALLYGDRLIEAYLGLFV